MVKVNISQILEKLEEGKTRQEIAKELGVAQSQMKEWFETHPKLIGQKPRRYMLIDDTYEVDENQLEIPFEESETFSDVEVEAIKKTNPFNSNINDAEISTIRESDLVEREEPKTVERPINPFFKS